jgi:hypothetical protein
MRNDVMTLVQAGAGDYTSVTANGHTYYQSQRAVQTATVVSKGVQPIYITMPVDPSSGVAETLLAISLLLQNQQQLALAWSKKNQTLIPFVYQTIATDQLTVNSDSVFTYARK